MSTPLSLQQDRITPVDAARGFAMLMVFLSHIKQHFEVSAPTLHWFLLSTTRVATPTFLLLSGFVVRLLLRTDTRGSASLTLVDRGLFLLIVGHALLGVDDFPQMSFPEWLFGRAGPVEAIGVALFIAVLLRNASALKFAALGVGLFAAMWTLDITVATRNQWAIAAGPALWQLNAAADWISATELVNEVGIFLLGMALSAHLESKLIARDYASLGQRLFLYGMTAVLAALAGVVAWHFSKHYVMALVGDPQTGALFRRTLDPSAKDPPSPGYLLFYGGVGLAVLAAFFRAAPGGFIQRIANRTAVIGRASLMSFIVQDLLFFAIPYALGLGTIISVPFWLAYLAVCLVLLYSLAHLWGRARGNRFLTVGLKRLVRRARASPWPREKHQGA